MPFSVRIAAISGVSPSSGVPGTVVTVAGSGFGAAQGSGQVWLGTVPGVVQSWSDAQVVAAVGAGSATGNASVLQNGVLSNAVPFTVNSLQLTSVSPNSGAAGTPVTFTSAGFGASQGTGEAWLGSMDGQVVSWSDTQIVATVATGALTGIARVQQNGVWSNAVTFTVPGAGGLQLEPVLINMVVGDTNPMQAVNSAGQSVTGLTWASSDTTVASLSTDDPPILTAVAAGRVTITAGTATANVTVWATTPPVGTVLWSNPGDGSGVTSIVPAVPSGYGVADVFAFQGDGTVQAITGDGTMAWATVVPPMWPAAGQQMRRAAAPRMRPAGRYRQPAKLHPQSAEQDQQPAVVVPDFRGGLVMMTGDSIMGLDGTTGQPTFTYTLPGGGGWMSDPAVHPDGTIFAGQYDGNGNSSVVGIDPTTGATKLSVPIPPPNVSQAPAFDIIIAGDGYAYVPHWYADISSPCGPDFTSSQLDHLMLLRIGSDGSYDDFDVFDWLSPSFCHEGGIMWPPQ
ncbi:MAG: IPT/TIG domain-containing protein, partial [Bryobacteraceae bacterium]